MKYQKKILFALLVIIGMYSCEEKNQESKKIVSNDIIIDTSFAGARLTNFQKVIDGRYKGYILPENEPINSSPWFAFGIHSKEEIQIQLELNYGSYKHRYIPKLSYDKVNWKPMLPSQIKTDTAKGTATLTLSLSSKKLYVAAQEMEPSAKTYAWVDSLVVKNPMIRKNVAGKTVLNKDNFVLLIEQEEIKNSLVLIARQHPPEIPGGSFAFKSFYETIVADTELSTTFRNSFNIYTFPLINPDGADLGNWRHNANGKDLNRDWIDFSQPETQMVKSFLTDKTTEGKRVRFGIDFHTSFSGPYLLVLDSVNENTPDKIIPNWIENIEENSIYEVNNRKRSQELPYCYNYFFNELNAEAVTYEDGDEIDRAIIRKKAQIYAEQLMKTLLNTYNAN